MFSNSTIRITAMTGAAATEIGGQTTASVFQYMRKKTHATQDDINAFADTRLNFIDEISFADYDHALAKISHNLQNFTQCHDWCYGKIPICFFGDFCQLEAIGGNTIYKHRYGIYWEQALNCMVELKGGHRYKDCSQMQRIMPLMRAEGLSEEDREILNSRVIDGNNVKMPSPATVRFATYYNKKRCNINADVFLDYLTRIHFGCTEGNICESAIVVKANALWGQSKKNLTFDQRKVLFEECSEADIQNTQKQRCDPMLCLFDGCNVMGNENSDVGNGIANGTTCMFRKVHFKVGVTLQRIQMHGFWVYAASVDDIDCLELEWQDSSMYQGKFYVFPQASKYHIYYPVYEFYKKVRIKTSIYLTQFPIVINHATTGHKLQGKSMIALVIAEWSKVKNWAYVVLSRVRTLSGLFLTEPIPVDIDFLPPPEYLDMMDNLRSTVLATSSQVEELKSTL